MPETKSEVKRRAIQIGEFISSGSTLLNLALSGRAHGGWRTGRVGNIVGDKSTGKTLLAIEAITYALKVLVPQGVKVKCVYDETESAFDREYAERLGMPIDLVTFRQSETIEDWYESLVKDLEDESVDLTIEVLDSLDALTSKGEIETDFTKGSYNMSKQKQASALLRRLIREVENKKMLLIIVSQVRDKIGVVFGKTQERTGGKALDFYASQVVWLAQAGVLKKKYGKQDLAVGVEVRASVDKNKIALPFRKVSFPILFEYGIDDIGSMVDFLIDHGVVVDAGRGKLSLNDKKYTRDELILEMEDQKSVLVEMVKKVWEEVEANVKQKRRPKYE